MVALAKDSSGDLNAGDVKHVIRNYFYLLEGFGGVVVRDGEDRDILLGCHLY